MQSTNLILMFSLLGTSILLSLTFLPPQEIHSEKELSLLIENQNIITTGKVVHISTNKALSFIDLDNNITIVTSLITSIIQGKNLRVQGIKETYKGKSQIKATRIQTEP